jgi:hypothetical protein
MPTTIDPRIAAEIDYKVNNNLPDNPDHVGNIFYRSRLSVTDTFEQPPVVLTINQDQRESIISTLGNISTIIGKAKSRKTYFVSLLAGLFLRNGEILPNAPQLRATLPPDKRSVLYVDTEQGRFHALKVLRRIVRIAGLPEDQQPENLHYLSLRPFNPDQRLQAIAYALEHLNNIGVIVIDGSRDMVYDINSPQEATTAVNQLMRWTDDLQVHCINIIHQNKNDLHARGHLGSELINKSESVISVEKDDDQSIIKSLQLRDRDFNDMAFMVDESDCPYLLESYQAADKATTPTDPQSKPDQLHSNLLDFVFGDAEKFTFNEFWKVVKKHANNSDIKIGDNKAREWANYYLNKNLVENSGTEKRMIIQRVTEPC